MRSHKTRLVSFLLLWPLILSGIVPTSALAEEAASLVEQEVATEDVGIAAEAEQPGSPDNQTPQDEPQDEPEDEPTPEQTGPVISRDGDLYLVDADGNPISVVGWYQLDDTWYYVNDASGLLATGWKKSGKAWYWLDSESGAMATGFISLDDGIYHLGPSGAMSTGWQKLDGSWYLFASSGVMRTGWQKDHGTWYWLDPETGIMATGWQDLDGERYLLASSGAMQTGWKKLNGAWYYLKPSGALATGWQKVSGVWYWLDSNSGAMSTGWELLDGLWYYFSGSGAMQTGWVKPKGTWYYLKPSGAMATGWQKLNGRWYWLDETSGALKTGWLHLGSTWYLQGENGCACNEFKSVNGTWYAFDKNCAWRSVDATNLADGSLSSRQRSVISACRSVPNPGKGFCALWVSQVFKKAGGEHLYLDACDMADRYCTSKDFSKLKPGMIIAVRTHSHTPAGQAYEHVCIYIGNGKVMDGGLSVGVRVCDLGSWLWWYGDTVTPKWGWYGNVRLS